MRKYFFILSLFLFFTFSVFAKSGFEGIINIPVGLSVGIPIGKIDGFNRSIGLGFDFAITAQLGYVIDFKNSMGISILGDTGYSYDTYSYYVKNGSDKIQYSIAFHSFQIGILPKYNIKDFSIGIGVGLKIPIIGSIYSETKIDDLKSTMDITKLNTPAIIKIYDKMNVIPYIKLTFDYTVFNNYNVGANFGLYANYEFGTRTKIDSKRFYSADSFDIGIQIGLRFSSFESHKI